MKRLLTIVSIALVSVLALTVGAFPGLPIHPTGPQHSAFAQIAATPTSIHTSTGDGPVVEDLEPFDADASLPAFPNLDSTLVLAVEQIESGYLSAQSAAAALPLNVDDSIGVTVHIREGYVETVSEFLTGAGASVRNTGTDYIEAYVPVSLLPSASEQEGVISIRTIIPSFAYSRNFRKRSSHGTRRSGVAQRGIQWAERKGGHHRRRLREHKTPWLRGTAIDHKCEMLHRDWHIWLQHSQLRDRRRSRHGLD